MDNLRNWAIWKVLLAMSKARVMFLSKIESCWSVIAGFCTVVIWANTGQVPDVVFVLTDLQRVFAGDIQKLLGSTIEVADLTGEAVDLGLGIDSHESSQNAGNCSKETLVSGVAGVGIS